MLEYSSMNIVFSAANLDVAWPKAVDMDRRNLIVLRSHHYQSSQLLSKLLQVTQNMNT